MQFRQYPLPPDPVPVLDPRPDPYASGAGDTGGFINDGGVLAFINSAAAANWPISSLGLQPGAVWNNGLTVAIVPGGVVNPMLPRMYFGVSPATLLSVGGAGVPTAMTAAMAGTGQLWNNGGVVCVA
jgi:hypothetical protein